MVKLGRAYPPLQAEGVLLEVFLFVLNSGLDSAFSTSSAVPNTCLSYYLFLLFVECIGLLSRFGGERIGLLTENFLNPEVYVENCAAGLQLLQFRGLHPHHHRGVGARRDYRAGKGTEAAEWTELSSATAQGILWGLRSGALATRS